MDGAEVARRVGRSHPDVPVLLITGYTGASDKVLHLPRLAKPFGRAELASSLASLFSDDDKVVRLRSPKSS